MNASPHQILTVTLPDIGEGVVEGEVIAWIKQEGDFVGQDEPVVVVMTDKATVELPAPQPGKIVKHYFQVGEIAIKDKPLYDIQLSSPSEKPSLTEKVLASPVTRKTAQERQVNLQKIVGTGSEGRITLKDVEERSCSRFSKTPITRFEGDYEEPFVGMKQKMADKMSEAMRSIPHFSFFERADVSRLIALKNKLAPEALQEGIKLTYMPFFIRALSLCIHKFPLLNSSLDQSGGVIVFHKPHNIGVAMAAPYGLIVPVIKNVDKLSLKELIHAYEDIKTRAFQNKLQNQDMKEGTLTLTNFGALEGASLGGTPIINTPEAAICGIARILKTPVVVNNEIVIRDIMNVSFSFDHRLIDGQLASKVSSEFCSLLENPHHLI